MLWLPATARGLGEPEPPSSFHFPGKTEFSGRLATGLRDLYAGDQGDVLRLDPPVQASATALKCSIESATGSSIGALAAGQLPAGTASVIYELTGALVDSAVDLAVEAATKAAAELVGDAINVIPVLGQIVSGLFGVISSVFQAHEAKGERLDQELQLQLDYDCKNAIYAAVVEETSMHGPTPADQFRQVAYAFHSGARLPVCVASMYVLLCGGQTGGFGFADTAHRDTWLRARSSWWPTEVDLTQYGIEPGLQRKMWSLIRGIMAAVQDPAIGSPPSETDQGRTLMPILQEIVRQQRIAGRIPDAYLHALSDFVAHGYETTACIESGWGEAGGTMCRTADCMTPRRIDLVDPLLKSVKAWENKLYGTYYRNGKWSLTPTGLYIQSAKSRGLLRMSPAASSEIANSVTKATSTEPFTPLEALILGTGMLGAGYGAWQAVRRYGPRRRR